MPIASSFQLRVLGAFSRHVLKGMRRIDSDSPDHDLLTAAFTDGTRNTLIVLNRSTSAQHLHLHWTGAHWTELERTNFYSENVDTTAPADVVIAPGEIVTLSNFSAPGSEETK
jgi:hypothetical protein